MKIKNLVSCLFLVAFVTVTSSTVINCDYNNNWGYMILDNIYRCEVIEDPDVRTRKAASIDRVVGFKPVRIGNQPIDGFDSRGWTFHYFPRGLEHFFPKLKSIAIYNSGMLEISKEELEPFKDLVNLYIDGNNIEVLEKDLFVNNPKLMGISFYDNRIKDIHPDVFDHVTHLTNLWLNSNTCIDMEGTWGKFSSVIRAVKDNCQPDVFQNLN